MFEPYNSLPKRVLAVQFTEANKNQIFNTLTGQYAADFEDGKPILKVKTIHGDIAIVRINDWIVKEKVKGFYYPIKDEIFRADYV